MRRTTSPPRMPRLFHQPVQIWAASCASHFAHVALLCFGSRTCGHRGHRGASYAQDEAAAAAEEEDVKPAPLPAKLLNNAAVLHMRAGETTAALGLVQEAIAVRLIPNHSLRAGGHRSASAARAA